MDFKTFVTAVCVAAIISTMVFLGSPVIVPAAKRFAAEIAANPPTFTYDVDEFWAKPRC